MRHVPTKSKNDMKTSQKQRPRKHFGNGSILGIIFYFPKGKSRKLQLKNYIYSNQNYTK